MTREVQALDCVCVHVQVCAPYSALQGYTLKVKLTPGTQKKGKGGRQVNRAIDQSPHSALLHVVTCMPLSHQGMCKTKSEMCSRKAHGQRRFVITSGHGNIHKGIRVWHAHACKVVMSSQLRVSSS